MASAQAGLHVGDSLAISLYVRFVICHKSGLCVKKGDSLILLPTNGLLIASEYRMMTLRDEMSKFTSKEITHVEPLVASKPSFL